MRRARSVLAVLLVGALLFSTFAVLAEESPCVQGYRKANVAFYSEVENIRRIQTWGQVGQWVGVGSGVTCGAVFRRSWTGILLCGLAGSAIAVPAYFASTASEAELDQLTRTYQLEDFYLTYQAYFAYITGLHAASDEARNFIGAVGADPSRSNEVLEQLKTLMESGELCDGGDTPRLPYLNVLELVRARL